MSIVDKLAEETDDPGPVRVKCSDCNTMLSILTGDSYSNEPLETGQEHAMIVDANGSTKLCLSDIAI